MSAENSYTSAFFDCLADGSLESARRIVPILMELVRPSSVVDVGCGTAEWLAVFRELGIAEMVGIDGDYVQRDKLKIPAEQFMARDLSKPLDYSRQFDLAISMEVGEHLPEAAARGFVEGLTRLAPVVAFSAAVPRQGGVDHINEQWPEYWAAHFRELGYVAIDAVRNRVWNDERVMWYYRQNLILYVRENALGRYPQLERERSLADGKPLSLVHPQMYALLHYYTRPENISSKMAARFFVTSLKAAIGRRIGGKKTK